MRDKDLILRGTAAGALNTGTVAGTFVDLQGLPTDGIDIYVVVPLSTAGGTLDITIEDGSDGSNPIDTLHTFKQIASHATLPQLFHARLSGYRRWLRYKSVAGGQNFGTVLIWLAAGPFKIAGE